MWIVIAIIISSSSIANIKYISFIYTIKKTSFKLVLYSYYILNLVINKCLFY